MTQEFSTDSDTNECLPWKCKIRGCAYKTRLRKYLKEHEKRHKLKQTKPFGCYDDSCGYKTTEKMSPQMHLSEKHQAGRNRNFQCPMCPSRFFTQAHLQQHINIHVKEKPLKCNQCDYSTYKSGDLSRHLRTVHDKSFKLHCPHPRCNFGTVNKSSFKTHRQRHIPNPRHSGTHRSARLTKQLLQCELCDYHTYRKDQLTDHKLTIHSDVRKLKCDSPGCNYKTNYPRRFKSHVLIHEKDPLKRWPITCRFPGCDYRRRSKGELKLHEEVHENSERQLKCDLCQDKKYPDENSLLFHKWMCHDGKSYECSYCVYAVHELRYLAVHVNTSHKERLEHQDSSMQAYDIQKIPAVLLTRLCIKIM